jgi:ATP phosphoribosyltransferase regulatory subunit
VLDDARAHAPNGGVKRALAELAAIVAAVRARKVDARLHVDLGEVRGFDYYTGVRFQAFVPGASDAVLRGGRYDGLLARYGRPSPAVGFAVDVDGVAGALESSTPPRSNGRPRRARSKE